MLYQFGETNNNNHIMSCSGFAFAHTYIPYILTFITLELKFIVFTYDLLSSPNRFISLTGDSVFVHHMFGLFG